LHQSITIYDYMYFICTILFMLVPFAKENGLVQ
jgi:hypothetical protein